MTKFIHLNLKRFDISDQFGGVNHDADFSQWGSKILSEVQPRLATFKQKYDVDFAAYLPEAHLIPARQALVKDGPLSLGCQSIYREDVSPGGNFGAFTTNRTATSMKQLGITHTIIGHYEERLDKMGVMEAAQAADINAVNDILNQEIKKAQAQGLFVLYCIGESEVQKPHWKEILEMQLKRGLAGVDMKNIAIAYEPIWAIGPGKTPPDAATITEVADFIKSLMPELPLLYGGGLKKENAKELAAIKSLDGGLIALTRFSGEIGFYPEEYLEIIEEFLEKQRTKEYETII